ncbi:MAG TPA: hypothetical protein VFN61_06335 [Acidimicrobiales bacterium]|nr:hypothetical protein [Acidimicrobiales bacterium]
MRRVNWWTVAVVALVVASLFFAISTATAISACFGHAAGNNTTGPIVAAVIFALLTALLASLAFMTEHHAKSRSALCAIGSLVPGTFRYLWQRPVSTTKRRLRRVAIGYFAVVWFGVLIAFSVNAIVEYGNWARTNETQSHGTHELAKVTSVDQIYHGNESSYFYTYNYEVRLAHPVGRATYSTVYTPEQTQFAGAGQRISVLVDPYQPAYAELPGEGMATLGAPIALTVAALVMMAAATWLVLRVAGIHRLQHSASTAFSGSTSATPTQRTAIGAAAGGRPAPRARSRKQ